MILAPEQMGKLPVCQAIIKLKGEGSKYTGDCVIRHYQGRHLSELSADLGEAFGRDDEVTIHGGIGTLIMRWRGNEFMRAPALMQMATDLAGAAGRAVAAAVTGQPVMADKRTIAHRKRTCEGCPYYRDLEKRCAACGCFTIAKAAIAGSTCPKGKW
jgi:hypothetical protein